MSLGERFEKIIVLSSTVSKGIGSVLLVSRTFHGAVVPSRSGQLGGVYSQHQCRDLDRIGTKILLLRL